MKKCKKNGVKKPTEKVEKSLNKRINDLEGENKKLQFMIDNLKKITDSKVAIMTFRIPEDESDYYYQKNGNKFASVLRDIDTYLRNEFKYKNKKLIDIAKLREYIGKLEEDEKVNPWEY